MPTGYTADINENTSFEEFALRCARAFGALVMMRDDALDARIPDEFKTDEHYFTAVREARDNLEKYKSLTDDQLKQEFRDQKERDMLFRTKYLRGKRDKRRAYERMLAMAESWTPPSEGHEGMKKFMVDQLKQSIDHDCDERYYKDETPSPSFKEWKRERAEVVQQSLVCAEENLQSAIKTAETRTKWVRLLRESLNSKGMPVSLPKIKQRKQRKKS